MSRSDATAAQYRRPRATRTTAPVRVTERALERHRERVAARHHVRTADALVRMVDGLGFCFAFTAEVAYPVPAAFGQLGTRSEGREWEWVGGWEGQAAGAKPGYYGEPPIPKPEFVSM